MRSNVFGGSASLRRGGCGVRGACVVAGLAAAAAAGTAGAAVIHSVSGISPAGVPVEFEAHLTITGDTLTVELFNNSANPSLNPADLLSSYFFDIVDAGNNRPILAYVSAVGDVWLTDHDELDTLQTADADLRAVAAGDLTWQFKSFDTSIMPFLAFGVGTVGNSLISPNNFNGNIVGAIDYSIYSTEITTSNLDGRLLVKGPATFTFTGVSGFTEADISSAFAFGLGTGPDALIPAPGSLALVGAGGLVVLRRRR